MAGEQKVSTYRRLRYFDGLFLRAEDFETEARFHVATRRYLNYLLFDAGVLHVDEAEPLEATADGTTTLTIAPGTAMIRDEVHREGHEVHLAEAESIDLADAELGLADGDHVYLTVDFEEEAVFSDGGDSDTELAEEDRRQEWAVIMASTTAPSSTARSVLLAEVEYHAAGIADADVTDRRARGGLRYPILSQDLIERLATPAVEAPVIEGIDPPTGVQGETVPVTVSGQHFTGASVELVPANGLAVADLLVANTEIRFLLRIDTAATPGDRDVRVTTPAGTASSAAVGLPFKITAAAELPVIERIDPLNGVQGEAVPVTLSGQHFAGASVQLVPADGLAVADLLVAATEIRFLLRIDPAAEPGDRDVRATTPAGTASSAAVGLPFNITAARVLESITIAAEQPAIAEGGTSMQLTAIGHFSVGPDDDVTGEVSWITSDSTVATIAGDGTLTSGSAGVITVHAEWGELGSSPLQIVVGVPVIAEWPDDPARRAHGTETLTIYGERFVDPLEVRFLNAVVGEPEVWVDGESVSLTEARVVVPGPFRPTDADPALVRSGRIRVRTPAGTSLSSPQNFVLATV